MSFLEDLVKLRNEIDCKKSLLERFPNLDEHIDRWNNKRLFSKDVNSLVDKVMFKHNCGCCEDSPLEAWPYLEAEGKKVFSDPPYFNVGEKCGYGDREYEGWEEKLRKVGLSETVVELVRSHLDKMRPREG